MEWSQGIIIGETNGFSMMLCNSNGLNTQNRHCILALWTSTVEVSQHQSPAFEHKSLFYYFFNLFVISLNFHLRPIDS